MFRFQFRYFILVMSMFFSNVSCSNPVAVNVIKMEVLKAKYRHVFPFSEGFAIVENGGKYSYVDTQGNEMIPFKYDVAWSFENGFSAVAREGKWTFIDTKGNEIAPPRYNKVMPFEDGLARVRLNWKWGLINTKGELITPIEYDEIFEPSEGYVMVAKDHKIGYLNYTGELVIPIQYNDGTTFVEGLAIVLSGETLKLIDTKGKQKHKTYDDIWHFNHGLARILQNGKFGFINNRGKEIIPPKYDRAKSFRHKIAIVGKESKYGIINTKGKEIVAIDYDSITWYDRDVSWSDTPASRNLISIEKDGKCGFLNNEGKELTPLKYDAINIYCIEGKIKVKIGDKYGFINLQGEEVIPVQYHSLSEWKDGYCVATLDEYDGIIDSTGQVVVPFKFDYIRSVEKELGVARIRKSFWDGLIDIKSGGEIIYYEQYAYTIIYTFVNGLAKVCYNNKKYGFINSKGIEIIPPVYDKVYSIRGAELVALCKDKKWAFADMTGELLTPFVYEEFHMQFEDEFKEGLLPVLRNGWWGYIDKTGKEVIECQYRKAFKFEDGLAMVTKDGKDFEIDKQGNIYRTIYWSWHDYRDE